MRFLTFRLAPPAPAVVQNVRMLASSTAVVVDSSAQWASSWLSGKLLPDAVIIMRHLLFSIIFFPTALACGSTGAEIQKGARDWDAERTLMVEAQLKGRDIHSARVLDAMRVVPRHLFIPESWRAQAYTDGPVPIGYGQTISQPYIVAFMTEALNVEPNHRVLEIGTGSGYQAAVLSMLAQEVYTIEIIEPLAKRAGTTLSELGYRNVQVRAGNGYLGWPEHAPFDRIIVTAAADEVPPALVQQLKIGGLMAIPVGTINQELRILRRTPAGVEPIRTLPVLFVPLTGKPIAHDTLIGVRVWNV